MSFISSIFCILMGIVIYVMVFIPLIFFSYIMISTWALSIIKIIKQIKKLKGNTYEERI